MHAVLLPILLTFGTTPAARQDAPKLDGDWKMVELKAPSVTLKSGLSKLTLYIGKDTFRFVQPSGTATGTVVYGKPGQLEMRAKGVTAYCTYRLEGDRL